MRLGGGLIMKIEVDPKLAENAGWANTLAQANRFIESLPGPATMEAAGAWHPGDGADRAELELRFTDPPLTMRRTFRRADLKETDEFKSLMYTYWGDFLSVLSR